MEGCSFFVINKEEATMMQSLNILFGRCMSAIKKLIAVVVVRNETQESLIKGARMLCQSARQGDTAAIAEIKRGLTRQGNWPYAGIINIVDGDRYTFVDARAQPVSSGVPPGSLGFSVRRHIT